MFDPDNTCALAGFMKDLDVLITSAEGVLMKKNIPDREALEIAINDLENAKAMLIMALTSSDVAH